MPADPEKLREASELLKGGASFTDAQAATGLARPTLYKYFPDYIKRRGDPTPGGTTNRKQPPKPHKPRATDEQLANLFAKIASAPAVPMSLWLHCNFCAEHFANTGPEAATKLVELSQDHTALREVMETVYRYADSAAWAGILAVWLGVPMLHHLAPDAIYNGARFLMPSLPARGAAPQPPPHAHAQPAAESNGYTPTPPETIVTPFGAMDTDQLLAMARSFGINIDLVDDAATTQPTEPAPEPEQPAEPDPSTEPETVETVTADTDAGK